MYCIVGNKKAGIYWTGSGWSGSKWGAKRYKTYDKAVLGKKAAYKKVKDNTLLEIYDFNPMLEEITEVK